MSTNKALSTFALIIFFPLLISACGAGQQLTQDQELATVVSMTMATRSSELQTAEAASGEVELSPGDMQPLAVQECNALEDEMGQLLPLMISKENVLVQMSWSGEIGSACQLTGIGRETDFENIFYAADDLKAMLGERSWLASPSLPCLGHGGMGPAADQSCFAKDNRTCEIMVTHQAEDLSMCDGLDDSQNACIELLSGEKRNFTFRLTCAEGKLSMPIAMSETERIEFAIGTSSAQVQGRLAPRRMGFYVLSAAEGQEMTLILTSSGSAFLNIWGPNGLELLSDDEQQSSWTGILPLTQDYYIDVISEDEGIIAYVLVVTIPALESGEVYPRVEPFPFGHMQAFFISGVPPMLPPEFPMEEGLPALVPYGLGGDPGEYAFSLDYGIDCQGAGVCHFGVISGMQNTSQRPIDTSNFFFEAEGAPETQVVELAKNITGYFIDYSCGASCSDAMIWWLYDGYQYMLGLKAGPRDMLIELANAAITNSIP